MAAIARAGERRKIALHALIGPRERRRIAAVQCVTWAAVFVLSSLLLPAATGYVQQQTWNASALLANAVRNVLRLLKDEKSLAPCEPHLIPLADYYDLVGLKALLAREEAYDKAAAQLMAKRAAE